MTYTRLSLRAARRGKNEKREIRKVRTALAAAEARAAELLAGTEAARRIAVRETRNAEVYRAGLVEIKTVTDAIKVPNGTTKKLARIAEAALA